LWFQLYIPTLFATLGRTNQTFALLPNDLFEAIEGLKQELNAVILAHYYQEPDIDELHSDKFG
jgi:quinolinate synthase